MDTRMLFQELGAIEPPTSTIDVDAAIGAARGHRRRRRAGLLTVAVVAVLTTAVAVPLLRPERPPVATTGTSAPTRFDPRRFQLELGWKPAGMVVSSRDSAETSQSLDLQPLAHLSQIGKPAWWLPLVTVELFPVGSPEPEGNAVAFSGWEVDRQASPSDGPDVRGGPSHWYGSLNRPLRSGRLAWQWAPGAWASVTVYQVSDARAVATRIARSLRTDASVAVSMPFTVPALAGLRLTGISITTWADPNDFSAALTFVAGGAAPRWAPTLTVEADRHGAGIPRTHGTTLIDGRPTLVNPVDAAAAYAEVYLGTTAMASVDNSPSAGKFLRDRNATIALAQAVRLVDDPTDRDNWTTDYFR